MTVTSNDKNTSLENENFIPRIIDNANVLKSGKIQPKEWTCQDVVTFLKKNDCSSYLDNFVNQVSMIYKLH